MVCPRNIVLYSCVTLCLNAVLGSGVNDTLVLVNLVYRHGDRSPVISYPNNPTNNTVAWPDGLGWLTEEGERMHYSLGRFLRRRYDGFLSDEYKNTEITVESSYVDRCLMSAYSNLAGLYPPSGDQVWNKNIPWQPIPVHTRPKKEDNMLALGKSCPKYHQIYQNSRKSDRVIQIELENKVFFDFVSEKAGLSLNIDNLWIISDTVYCEKMHNITLPPWINDTIYQKLRDLEAWGWDLLYHTMEERRLQGGPLLKEWLKLTDQKRTDDKYTTKMNMFSAHDSTVVALMSALDVYNGQIPPYTTTVMMELYQEPDGEYFVELYLRNVSSEDPNDDTQPYQLTLPGCDFQCPYQQFVSLTKAAVPVDWDAECTLETSSESEDIDFKRAFIITVAVYSVVALCLLLVVMVMCFRRNRRAKAGMV